MAMFAVGVMMAVERERIVAVMQRQSRGQTMALVALALVALGAFTWGLPSIWPPLEVVSLAGAALLVMVFLGGRHVLALAGHRVVQWPGRRSFSLYVVHFPLVVVSELFVPRAGRVAPRRRTAVPAGGRGPLPARGESVAAPGPVPRPHLAHPHAGAAPCHHAGRPVG